MTSLNRLRELEAAAPPAPWQYAPVANHTPLDAWELWDAREDVVDTSEPEGATGDFIAESRNALPGLLAVAEAAKALDEAGYSPVGDEQGNLSEALEALTTELGRES